MTSIRLFWIRGPAAIYPEKTSAPQTRRGPPLSGFNEKDLFRFFPGQLGDLLFAGPGAAGHFIISAEQLSDFSLYVL